MLVDVGCSESCIQYFVCPIELKSTPALNKSVNYCANESSVAAARLEHTPGMQAHICGVTCQVKDKVDNLWLGINDPEWLHAGVVPELLPVGLNQMCH